MVAACIATKRGMAIISFASLQVLFYFIHLALQHGYNAMKSNYSYNSHAEGPLATSASSLVY